LSSAILYVAIVVIWAGVLIPRWLRRDSSDTAAAEAEAAELASQEAPREEPSPGALSPGALSPGALSPGALSPGALSPGAVSPGAVSPDPVGRSRPRAPERPRRAVASEPSAREADEDAEFAAEDDPGHRRVVTARRRLLLMLVGLSIASGVLAGTRMAAWWVIVPPSVMLLGYVLLLREASKADAERREMARYRADRAAAEARRSAAAVAHVTPVAASGTGAPGTASAAKIIAFLPPPEEQAYDQYTDAKLRAVGD
jgi:hypothetical protein